MGFKVFSKIALIAAMFISTVVVSASAYDQSDDDVNASIIDVQDSNYTLDHYRGRRDICYPQAVDLVCKVNGRHEAVTGYVNCGRGYEGSLCYNVEVPGYRVIKMNVTYRCEYGQWRMIPTRKQGCSLIY